LLRIGALLLILHAVPGFVGAAAGAVPAGFTDTQVAAIASPEGLAFTPDGRLLVTSQAGFVRVVANGTLLATPALDLRAKLCNDSEGGIPGIAVDPSFATNRFVYLYYTFNKSGVCEYGGTARSPVNRVSRFVLSDSNSIDPLSEVVLLDNMPAPEAQHIGGDLQFGKDGYLYVSVGDGACDYLKNSGCFASNDASRDQNALVGKILRITRDGGIPPGNPFTGADSGRCNTAGRTTAAKCQETYAWGLRNPFRMGFDPNVAGTRFCINDVGEQTWEEVDLGQAGADYGWNVREGFCALASMTNCGPPPAGMTNPIYTYGRSAGCKAATGAAFVPNGVWPAAYNGSYLYGDFVCGKIFQLVPATGGGFTANEFASLGAQTLIAMTFGPSSFGRSLYYTSFAGEVRRIDFVGSGNRTPTAMATATPTAGPLPLNVNFDATGSTDPDPGDTLTYVWHFGDGSPQFVTTSPRTSHTYTATGAYTAQLNVRDAAGATSPTITIGIYAGDNSPAPRIDFPTDTDRFAVGQTITLRGSATDPEDGPLPATALRWEVKLFHIDHTHPYLQPTSGNNIPIVGPKPEDLQPTTTANSYLIIALTATDSFGASTTVTRSFRPNLVNITFDSAPGGISIPVNETAVTTPQTLASWQGLGLNVAAPTQVTQGSTTYVFSSWSDGSTQATRTITTPGTATTYRATYQPAGTGLTVGVAAGGDDGDVTSAGGSYPPSGSPAANTTGTVLTAGRRFVFGGYEVLAPLLRFNTSALPDNATLTSATLRLYVTGKTDADNRNLVGEWYPSSSWPIDAADYALSSAANALAGADITPIATGKTTDFALTGLGSISKTAYSALRLHVSGGQPTGDNYVQIAAFDSTTLPEPQLIVTYTTAQAPVNSTPPVVSGTPAVGQTLTASTGTWTGTAPIAFGYQWQRCDAAGVCTDIGAATTSSYVLGAADRGFRIRVRVTGSNSGGSSSALSAMTATVPTGSTSTVTFSVATSGDDGNVTARGASYPPPGTPAVNVTGASLTAGRRFAFNAYENLVGLVRFNTSTLPDNATITSAKLRLTVTGKADTDGRNLVGEWYLASHWPIDASDYTPNANGGAFSADITALNAEAANELTLSNLGSILTTGMTGLRLTIDGGRPTGDNYVQLSTFDHATLTEPQLIVSYTTP
jgi:glucose/arabinose dehydrogenase/PKD repeat protein